MAVVSSAQSQSAKTTVRSSYLPASIKFSPQFVQLSPSSLLHTCTNTLALCDPDLRPLTPASGCVCPSVMAPVTLLVTFLTPKKKRVRKERADRYYGICRKAIVSARLAKLMDVQEKGCRIVYSLTSHKGPYMKSLKALHEQAHLLRGSASMYFQLCNDAVVVLHADASPGPLQSLLSASCCQVKGGH